MATLAGTTAHRGLLIEVPPRHGKSELISYYTPSWYVGTFPDRWVMLVSYSTRQAGKYGGRCRELMERAGPSLFGVRVSRDTRSKAEWTINGRQGGMLALGMRGSLGGRGADLLVIDDPIKNDREALSSAVLESHWEWWESTAFPRLHPQGCAVVMSTRWHTQDLIGRLLEREPQKWRRIRLPAIAEGTGDDPLGRAEGEALFPDGPADVAWPLPKLLEKRESMDPSWWNALYQQLPGMHGRTEWPDEYFGEHIWAADWPETFEVAAIALDPSKGREARKGDYSALVFVGIASGKAWVDARLARWPVRQLCATALECCREWNAAAIGIESDQFQELLLPEFDRLVNERGLNLAPTYSLPTGGVKKELRIRRLGEHLARGELRFRRSVGNRMLVDQLRAFPFGQYDDGPDALEMAVRLIKDIRIEPPPELSRLPIYVPG